MSLNTLRHIPIGPPDKCWEWTGGRTKFGYGQSHQLAHRWAYTRWVGPIPKGMFVCHHCDNPPCCNPRHLFIGTHADNMADMVAKGRANHPASKTHCPQGHPYDEVNTYVRPDGRSCVGCKQCIREARRRYRAKLPPGSHK